MKSQPAQTTTINFGGIEVTLPADMPFTHTADGNLILDFTAGYKGRLCLRPGVHNSVDGNIVPRLMRSSSPRQSAEPDCRPDSNQQSLLRPAATPNKAAEVIPDSQAGQSISWFHRSPPVIHSQSSPSGPVGQGANEDGEAGAVSLPFSTLDVVMPSRDEATLMEAAEMEVALPALSLANETFISKSAQPYLQSKQGSRQQMPDLAALQSPQPVAMERDSLPQAKESAPAKEANSTSHGNNAAAERSPVDINTALPIAGARENEVTSTEPDREQQAGAEKPAPALEQTPAHHGIPVNKENTPANKQGQQKGKRKSGSKTGHPSTGKRSGKKSKGTPGGSSAELHCHWRPLDCKGKDGLPQERWGATMTAIDGSQLCLFAGNSTDDQMGDTWILDVGSSTWKCTDVSHDPGRAWHAAVLVPSEEGNHIYAIGGERVAAAADDADEDDSGECLAEVCHLDMEAKIWVTLPVTGEQLQRSGHSATVLSDGRVLLFGGVDNDGRYRNDAHIIDVHRLNCFSLANISRGAPPKPRAYHTATLVGKSIIILGGTGARPWSLKEDFGWHQSSEEGITILVATKSGKTEVYSLSVETWQWKEHTAVVEGEAPTPRSGHSAVALPGDRYLLVFGGGIPDTNAFFSTVAILDTLTWTWSTPLLQGVARPCGRSGHCMALVQLPNGQHGLALHGGRTHDESLCKDTWILELSF